MGAEMTTIKALGRMPDVVIGEEENPYLLRWYVIPRNRFFNIYLHKFCRSDDDRALHDHPWLFNMSILLKGDYIEHVFKKRKGIYAMSTLPGIIKKYRRRGAVYFRIGKAPHRVQLNTEYRKVFEVERGFAGMKEFEIPVWTLFITGPKVRKWGFYCPKGKVRWERFVSITEKGNHVGRGCD